MNKKIISTFLAFALLAGVLSYWSIQNSTDDGFDVENKTVILQDDDNYSTTNTSPSLFSPLVVAGLGLALVASVPIALKILNYHSKKQLNKNKNSLKGKDATYQ